jgi:hypothetical protein
MFKENFKFSNRPLQEDEIIYLLIYYMSSVASSVSSSEGAIVVISFC